MKKQFLLYGSFLCLGLVVGNLEAMNPAARMAILDNMSILTTGERGQVPASDYKNMLALANGCETADELNNLMARGLHRGRLNLTVLFPMVRSYNMKKRAAGEYIKEDKPAIEATVTGLANTLRLTALAAQTNPSAATPPAGPSPAPAGWAAPNPVPSAAPSNAFEPSSVTGPELDWSNLKGGILAHTVISVSEIIDRSINIIRIRKTMDYNNTQLVSELALILQEFRIHSKVPEDGKKSQINTIIGGIQKQFPDMRNELEALRP